MRPAMSHPVPTCALFRGRVPCNLLRSCAAVLILLSILAGQAAAAPVNYQAGSVSINQTSATVWTSVSFTRTFTVAPVVVMGPATAANGDPCVVRVRNVTTTGFECQIDEWDYLTGVHPAETVHYLAITPGSHQLGTQKWEVGRLAALNKTATGVTFPTAFAATPVVLAQVETANNTTASDGPRALKTRINTVTTTGFQVQLEVEDASAAATISNEGIGYIAVSTGKGYLDGKVVNVVRPATLVTQAATALTFSSSTNPLLIAQSQTKNDVDPGELKMSGITSTAVNLAFQEEQSVSTDVTHTGETVGFLVMGDFAGETAAKIEAGELTVTQSSSTTWTTVTTTATYTTPVVVMGPVSYINGTQLTVRVRNVTSNSFQFQIDRWDHFSGQTHPYAERLSYIVMESGTYAVGGQIWQAGQKTGVTNATATQSLSTAFTTAPAVFAQVGTTVEASAVTARVHTVSATGFSVELDESEIADQTHSAETVHWIAVQTGTSHLFSAGRRFEAGITSTAVQTSSFRFQSFGRMHADPFLFAATQSKNDLDPATLRFRYLFAEKGEIVAQEDAHPLQSGETAVDNNHSAETLAWLVVQGATDTDEDGAPDSFETANGLNPNSAADGSLDPDGDLLTNQQEFHNGSSPSTFTGGTITVSLVASAYEVGNAPGQPAVPGRFRLNRIGGFAPLTLNFGITASATTLTNKDPAEPADYTLRTSSSPTGGTAVTTSIALAANATSVDVYVHPTVDTDFEYPEGLILTAAANGSTYVIGSPTNTTLTIYDAQETAANEHLFVGTFAPQGTAVTSGSGVTSLILNGLKNKARITSSFNGLTTPQLAEDGSHVHINGGTRVFEGNDAAAGGGKTFPAGGVADYPWTIVDNAGVKGKDIIDALYQETTGAFLYLNVHTSGYTSGEIQAKYNRQTGSSTPPADPPYPTLENLANDEEVKRDCARFLTQATFGASETDITTLFNSITGTKTVAANRINAFKAWMNTQWGLSQTRLYDYIQAADTQEWALIGQFNPMPVTTGSPPTTALGWYQASFDPNGNPAADTKESYDPDNNNRRRGWWVLANRAHDQLRQRAAFALEQILVISDREGTVGTRAYGHSRYFDMLADHTDSIRSTYPVGGTFGGATSFRDLLEDVSKSPMMGKYLSHLQNPKAQFTDTNGNGVQDPGEETTLSPDENYAREIMQLFSIGLLEIHPNGTLKLGGNGLPIQTYSNDDIKELSKIFTGWSFAKKLGSLATGYPLTNTSTAGTPASPGDFYNGGGNEYFNGGWEYPMVCFPAFHDMGSKQFLEDTEVPANTPPLPSRTADTGAASDADYCERDLDRALDRIFNHPNTAPFISRLLIQRFVTSNPSANYIHRVAKVFADSNLTAAGGVRGNMRAVIEAILTDYEARSLTFVNPQTVGSITSVNVSYGKVKEPIVRYIQVLRAFNAKSKLLVDATNTNDLVGYGYTQAANLGTAPTLYRYANIVGNVGQSPQNAPTVFNWYLPDYTPGGAVSTAGLVAPELQIMTENQVVNAINYQRQVELASTYFNTSTGLSVPGTGQGVSGMTGAGLTGSDHLATDDDIVADLTSWVSDYQNRVTAVASGGLGQTPAVAMTAVVDRMDALLTAGALKARYPYPAAVGTTNPRSNIIDQAILVSSGSSSANHFIKVRTALYLLTATPEFIVQK